MRSVGGVVKPSGVSQYLGANEMAPCGVTRRAKNLSGLDASVMLPTTRQEESADEKEMRMERTRETGGGGPSHQGG